jgi:hypothetical protein
VRVRSRDAKGIVLPLFLPSRQFSRCSHWLNFLTAEQRCGFLRCLQRESQGWGGPHTDLLFLQEGIADNTATLSQHINTIPAATQSATVDNTGNTATRLPPLLTILRGVSSSIMSGPCLVLTRCISCPASLFPLLALPLFL